MEYSAFSEPFSRSGNICIDIENQFQVVSRMLFPHQVACRPQVLWQKASSGDGASRKFPGSRPAAPVWRPWYCVARGRSTAAPWLKNPDMPAWAKPALHGWRKYGCEYAINCVRPTIRAGLLAVSSNRELTEPQICGPRRKLFRRLRVRATAWQPLTWSREFTSVPIYYWQAKASAPGRT